MCDQIKLYHLLNILCYYNEVLYSLFAIKTKIPKKMDSPARRTDFEQLIAAPSNCSFLIKSDWVGFVVIYSGLWRHRQTVCNSPLYSDLKHCPTWKFLRQKLSQFACNCLSVPSPQLLCAVGNKLEIWIICRNKRIDK